MKTMNHHDARCPEETMHYLPPVVPAQTTVCELEAVEEGEGAVR